MTTMTEATTTMKKVKAIQGVSSNNKKQDVREVLKSQIISFAKQTKQDVHLFTLPSTEWIFEKGEKGNIGLIKLCKQNKIKLKITGVENSPDQDVIMAFKNNAPKDAVTLRGDFDKLAVNLIDEQPNVYWADYCGNPAKAYVSKKTGKIRYSYEHMRTFRDVVAKTKKPALFFATYHCNGRIKGGADALQKSMSPQAKNIPCAIRHKMSQTLTSYGLSKKATKIASIYYHGAGIAFMVTIGFAINFTPKFPIVQENWVETKTTAKATKNIHVKVDWTGVKKDAMRALCSMGWKNEDIAHALNTQTGKVAPVTTWHIHRDSWTKGAKKVAK